MALRKFYEEQEGDAYGRDAARQKYLDILAKQRMSDQGMVNEARAQEKKAAHDASYQGSGDMGVKGAQMGLAAGGPWGALIGALIGKGVGAVKHGQKEGFGQGLKSFFDPTSDAKALLGMGADKSGSAGRAGAVAIGDARAQAENYRRAQELKRAEAAAGGGPGGNFQLEEPELGASYGQQPTLESLNFEDDEKLKLRRPY